MLSHAHIDHSGFDPATCARRAIAARSTQHRPPVICVRSCSRIVPASKRAISKVICGGRRNKAGLPKRLNRCTSWVM
ncbi:MAG: hypothetical protein IPP33_17075 [Flavobacteriales bacterium]|nr:hypothetical protein [Flavobacteriales bacterium]